MHSANIFSKLTYFLLSAGSLLLILAFHVTDKRIIHEKTLVSDIERNANDIGCNQWRQGWLTGPLFDNYCFLHGLRISELTRLRLGDVDLGMVRRVRNGSNVLLMALTGNARSNVLQSC